LSGQLRYDLDYVTIGDIFDFGLHEYLEQIQERLVEISDALHSTYCAAPRTKKSSRAKQSDIPPHKLAAEEHPNQRAKSEVGPEW